MGYKYGGAGKFEERWQKVRTVFLRKDLTEVLFCEVFLSRFNEWLVV